MCTCQNCERVYKMDLIVDDLLWDKIKPQNKTNESGLLCPACIVKSVEFLEGYSSYNIIKC